MGARPKEHVPWLSTQGLHPWGDGSGSSLGIPANPDPLKVLAAQELYRTEEDLRLLDISESRVGNPAASKKSDPGRAAREVRSAEYRRLRSTAPSLPVFYGPGPADLPLPWPGECDCSEFGLFLLSLGTEQTVPKPPSPGPIYQTDS